MEPRGSNYFVKDSNLLSKSLILFSALNFALHFITCFSPTNRYSLIGNDENTKQFNRYLDTDSSSINALCKEFVL
jgi:hypothetical protein